MVVALIAIIGGVGLWTVIRQVPGFRLNYAATQVLGDLRRARAQAVSENLPVEFSFLEDGSGYTLWTDRDEDGQRDPDELVTIRFPDDLAGHRVTGAPMGGVFHPRGTFTPGGDSNTMLVTITSPTGTARHILVAPSGLADPSFTP